MLSMNVPPSHPVHILCILSVLHYLIDVFSLIQETGACEEAMECALMSPGRAVWCASSVLFQRGSVVEWL